MNASKSHRTQALWLPRSRANDGKAPVSVDLAETTTKPSPPGHQAVTRRDGGQSHESSGCARELWAKVGDGMKG
jgi:hypothetical protein